MKSYLYRVALAMLLSGGLLANGQAALKSAKVSDVKGDVTVSKGGGTSKPAAIDTEVTPSDVVRTGVKSLAELQFNDNTLTRLGANTIFSYSPKNREFQVETGTALLQVPPGLGGAKIQTAAVTAAITGTTVMIQKLPDGVVKLMVLEGSMNATLKGSNQMQTIKAGQMLVIPPNVNTLPQPVVVNIATIMGTSKLITGFNKLKSVDKIAETEEKQEELAGNGGLKTGGVVITTTEDLLRLIGNNVLTSATFDALTQNLEQSEGQGHSSEFIDGPIFIDSGATLRPTNNGVLGLFTLADGQSFSAVQASSSDDTLFQLGGPVTFTGALPLISPSSTGDLEIFVLGAGLGATDPSISFINSVDGPGGDFASRLIFAQNGAINFNNADFNVNDTSFVASTGDLNISNGSTLTVDQGSALFDAGGNMNIDSSGIEVVTSSGGSSASLISSGTMTINNSTIGGNSGLNNGVNLSSNGNMNIVGSLIGGSGVSSVSVYAHNNASLTISSSSIVGSSIVLGGLNVSLTNVTVTGSSILIKGTYINGGGNSFSSTPSFQAYTP